MSRIMMVIFPISLLINCASVGHQINQEAAAKIEKGQTTREQVIQYLGSPDQITTNINSDTTFVYRYLRVTTKPESFMPCIGPFVGGANVQNQMFMVTFGPNGIVKNIFSTYGATESSHGITTGPKPALSDIEENKRP